MYANVCDSRRNKHPWPPHSQCPDVAIRQCSEKAQAALGRGRGCRGVGGGGDVGEGAVLLLTRAGILLAPFFWVLCLPCGKKRGLGPLSAPPSHRPPSGSSRSPFASSPIPALFLEHLIGDARPPLCQAPGACLLGPPSLVCKSEMVGG